MIRFKTSIKESPGKGNGLFAEEFIPKGELVYEDSISKIHKDNVTFSKEYMDMYTWIVGDYLYFCNDDTMYINHSFTPSVNGVDGTALKDIIVGEEITEHYSTFDPSFETYKNLLK